MTPQSNRRTRDVPVPIERRRGGRPSLAKNDPTTGIAIRLPASLYDHVYALARRDRVSVSEAIRRALRRAS